MELRLPRRPRTSAAQEPTRAAGSQALPEDDAWAGDDVDWTTDEDRSGEGRGDFARFFRGAAVGALAGAALWALVALTLVLWLD